MVKGMRRQVKVDVMLPFMTERSRLTINPGDITVNSLDHSTHVYTARHSPRHIVKRKERINIIVRDRPLSTLIEEAEKPLESPVSTTKLSF